jgi:hypothetical protein
MAVAVLVTVLVLERLRPARKAKVSMWASVRVAVDATTVPMKGAVHRGTVAAPRAVPPSTHGPLRAAKYNRPMEGDDRLRRARSFLIGGVVGASAALATARRRRELARRRRQRVLHPAGLAAFEDAPCYRELIEAEERAKE